jgi:hypothetical protein
MACNSAKSDETALTTPQPNEIVEDDINADLGGDYARDHLDLNAVGSLLEKSNSAENFEYLLNADNRVNNLDLNGDGYVDYISVAEYEDRDSNQRGFTLFDRFGPNDIQEVARILFDRDRNDDRGARIMLNGNEQLYGDNYYYEANWLDKSLNIVSWAFSDRGDYYRSPYYYDNYPNNYNTYRVVETHAYRTRIQEYYPQPIFIRTNTPTITLIKIRSSYKNRSFNSIFAKLAKPSKEQKEFRKSNPNRPEFVNKGERNDRSTKPDKSADKKNDVDDKRSKGDEKRSDDPGKQKNDEKKDQSRTSRMIMAKKVKGDSS